MRGYPLLIIASSILVLSGCNNSKSPDQVSKDIAKAEQKADAEVTKSEADAKRAIDSSYDKVSDQELKFNNEAAHQTYLVAVAKADGDRKVALATCESQSGDAQKACKTQAESDYKASQADAKANAQASLEHK